MKKVTIKKVENKRDLRDFIEFHYDLYAGNRFDAPNLFSDDMRTLSKESNAAFDFCDAEYFLALDERGKVCGRVAAIINRSANEKWQRKSVRFGWIDFVDDYEVSAALLEAVENYGRQHGMTEIIGPLGFTDMDPEGMLIEGFDQLGTMATIYNYPYYQRHMEALSGYVKDNDYVEWKVYIPEKIPERLVKISEMIQQRYNLHVKKVTKEDVFNGDYGKRIFDVVNATFKDLYGYSKLTDRQIDQYVKMYFPMIDLNLVTLIEDRNADNKVVGIGITLPSLTRALQKCRRGRLFPFGWWHVLRAIKFHKTKVVDLLLVGVLPEYRSKGANALLFYDLIPYYQKYGFEWGESHVEMEMNSGVQNQWQYFDSELHKRRRCYKKNL